MREKFTAGAAALAIYLTLVGLILYYFGYRDSTSTTHFVTKNRGEAIAVNLAGPPSAQTIAQKSPKSSKKRVKKAPKRKKRVIKRKRRKPKRVRKRVVKRRVYKVKPKRPNARKLFSRVKKRASKTPSHKEPAGALTGNKAQGSRTLKREKGSRGVENAYLAKVERLLKGWPAQANFAGEEIDIRLTIYQSGRFDYRILRLSSNPDFNHELINYLKQLQSIGFGPHHYGKPYDIEVKFIAHD